MAAAAGQREQPVHRGLMSKIQVVQRATLINPALQGPARLQLQSHKPVGIAASWYRGLTHQQWCPLLGVEGFEPQ